MTPAPDSRAEKAVDDVFAAATRWLIARPHLCGILDIATLGQLNRGVQAWTERRCLAYRLRLCGGGSPKWHESNARRAARVEHLARAGRDA